MLLLWLRVALIFAKQNQTLCEETAFGSNNYQKSMYCTEEGKEYKKHKASIDLIPL